MGDKTMSLREYIARRDTYLHLLVGQAIWKHAEAGGAFTDRECIELAKRAIGDAAAKWDSPLYPEFVAAIDAVRLPVKA